MKLKTVENPSSAKHAQIFYHITRLEYVESIEKEGLQPRLGPLSTQCNEPSPCIFLFPNKEVMEEAFLNWMGDALESAYGKDFSIVILEIGLPKTYNDSIVNIPGIEFELKCMKAIPTDYIHFLNEEYKPLKSL